MDPLVLIGILVVAIVVVVILIINTVGRLLRKVGPNQALIVYGAGGTRVITGGSHFVIPLYQRAQEFSLELMSFDVAPSQDLYTTQGVAVNVEAVTQIKVRSDPESVKTAAEQFLSKTQEERENLIRLVMEGHLRGIVGQLTVEDLVKDPENVGAKMLKTVTPDMEKMGLEVISFTIKDVRDKNDYISNMGRPQIVQIRKQADIASALAQRDTQIQQANAAREAAVAKSAADQKRVKAETESLALQAESQRNLSLKKAAFDAEVKKQQASADKAYDIQANMMQQQAIDLAAPGGGVVLLGIAIAEVPVIPVFWITREITVAGSINSRLEEFETAIRLLETRPEIGSIVTRRVSLEEVPETFELLLQPEGVGKVVVDPRR